jgi:hypothetical protein
MPTVLHHEIRRSFGKGRDRERRVATRGTSETGAIDDEQARVAEDLPPVIDDAIRHACSNSTPTQWVDRHQGMQE